jgi:hypothetical protein
MLDAVLSASLHAEKKAREKRALRVFPELIFKCGRRLFGFYVALYLKDVLLFTKVQK